MNNAETLVAFLTDLKAAETHLIHILRQHVTEADLAAYPVAQQLTRRLLSRSEAALPELEAAIIALGSGNGSTLKEAVSAISGTAAGVMIFTKSEKVTSMLRESYINLSSLAMDYELLYGRANAIGSTIVSQLSLRSLRTAAALLVELSQVIIPVAVDELNTDSPVDLSSVPASVRNIKSLWASS